MSDPVGSEKPLTPEEREAFDRAWTAGQPGRVSERDFEDGFRAGLSFVHQRAGEGEDTRVIVLARATHEAWSQGSYAFDDLRDDTKAGLLAWAQRTLDLLSPAQRAGEPTPALREALSEALNLIEEEAERIDCKGSAEGVVERGRAALDAARQRPREEPVPCYRPLIGMGGDSWDPLCALPKGHAGLCRADPEDADAARQPKGEG